MTNPIEDQHVWNNFLDDLRETGATNMFGAPAYLEALGLSKQEARQAVAHWMETFESRHTNVDNVEGE